MHRWFVQIICHEFRVSWMSLRMHIRLQQCCRSEMAWNSQTHCTRPLWLTYHTSAQEVLNVYTDPYYSFLNLSVMISSSFSLLSSCSLCFRIVSFPHLCSPPSSTHLGMTLISEWCKETPRCSRLPTFYTEENNKQKKKIHSRNPLSLGRQNQVVLTLRATSPSYTYCFSSTACLHLSFPFLSVRILDSPHFHRTLPLHFPDSVTDHKHSLSYLRDSSMLKVCLQIDPD